MSIDRDALARRFLAAPRRRPEEDGPRTFVSPTTRRKEREDTSDNPQALEDRKERGKPLPSEHSKGRTRRLPQVEFNTPGDRKPRRDENHSKPTVPVRTPGIPGEQYGHPVKLDYHTVTRRSLAGLEERFPSKRQQNQGGEAKRYYQERYRENKEEVKREMRMRYRKMKHTPEKKLDLKYRDSHPDRYKRRGEGFRSNKERAQAYRDQKKEKNAGDIIPHEIVDGVPGPIDSIPYRDRIRPQKGKGQGLHVTPAKGQTGPFRATPSVNYTHGELADRHKTNRTAALSLKDIDRGLSRRVRERSQSYSPVLKSREGNSYLFQTGDWEQHVKLSGRQTNVLSKKLADMRCSCPFYRWQGPEHWASEGNYQLGPLQGTASFPGVRDPEGEHPICKHLAAVFRYIRSGEASRNKLAARYLEENDADLRV